jgi:hypothetical protein
MVEEKLNKLDDVSRSVDRIAHDVENLKSKVFAPRVDISESIKALHVSMDERKKRIAMLRAKREFLEKALPPGFYQSNYADLKMIGVSSIDSLFSKVKIDDKGIEEESTLVRERPQSSEGENHDEKNIESGLEEVKTLGSNAPTILDFKDFNYNNCSLVECIALLQSMLNSPNAYEQNKAFTRHIVEVLMKALEDKLELEV